MLVSFLNEHPDIPIVAFNAKYDRDEVLGPAFARVGSLKKFPVAGRWRCTLKLSFRMSKLEKRQFDDILESLGLAPR